MAGASADPAHLDVGDVGYVNADRPGIDNHNSPAVAADPTRPQVVALADRVDSPRFSCTVSLSTNSGATWKALVLPLAPEAPNCFWPDVAFDADGRLYVLYSATGGRFNQPLGVWLQRFDGESASGPPVRVAGAEAFHAHFALDGRRVVVAYIQTPPANAERPLGFEPGPNPLMVARSEDGGATFGPPVRVSTTERVAHPSVVFAGPGGNDVLVGALDYADDVDNYESLHGGAGGPPADAHWRVLAWRSTDGAASFGTAPAVVADRIVVPQRVVIDLSPGPSFAAEPGSRTVYATWDGGTGDGREIFLARSTDGGASWSVPAAVVTGRGAQLLPAVDVAPGGRVDMIFYDRREDPNDLLARPTVASSWDGGATFVTEDASELRFDSGIGQGGRQGIPQLGNQLAVLSRADSFLAFWADTTRALAAADVMDLAVTSVTPHTKGERSVALVVVGLVVAAAGLAISLRRAGGEGRTRGGAAAALALALSVVACGGDAGDQSAATPRTAATAITTTTSPASSRVQRSAVVGTEFPLGATITLPPGPGPFPGVVLVHGTGALDEDETVGAVKVFRDLAHGLAERGVATLRYPKRTLVHPRAFIQSSFTSREETTDDARAAVDVLRAVPEVDDARVFVLGHSLGGYLVARIGAGRPDIAGFVIVAAPSRPWNVLARAQSDYLASLQRLPPAQEAERQADLAKWDRVVDPALTPDTPPSEMPFNTPAAYWIDLQGYDPAAAAAALPQPLLVLQGERDYQVGMEDFAGWSRALAGRPNTRLISYPKLDHLLVAGEGPSTPLQYQQAGRVATQVIDDIAAWARHL